MIKNIIMAAAGAGSAPVIISTPNINSPSEGQTTKVYIGHYSFIAFTGSSYIQTSGNPSAMAALQLQFSSSSGFGSIFYDTGEIATGSPSATLNESLFPDGLVYGRIRYKSASGVWSDWSSARSFTVARVYVFKTPTNTGTITVPTGKTVMRVKAWGSPSNGFWGAADTLPGGTGGFIEATINTTAGTNFKIVVGSTGYELGGGNAIYAGFGGSSSSICACGGGLSGVFVSDTLTPIVVAGGGGGRSVYYEYNNDTYSGNWYSTSYNAHGGNNAGGQTVSPIALNGTNGTSNNSSSYPIDTYYFGGAGGGGYPGGFANAASQGVSGSGGRNYTSGSASLVTSLAGFDNSFTVPNSSDTDYIAVGGVITSGYLNATATYSPARGLVLITFE